MNAEVNEWQSRPLDALYPIVYLDALFVNIKDQGHISKKAVYLALGINSEGQKELLGLWIEKKEGAKFWPRCHYRTQKSWCSGYFH